MRWVTAIFRATIAYFFAAIGFVMIAGVLGAEDEWLLLVASVGGGVVALHVFFATARAELERQQRVWIKRQEMRDEYERQSEIAARQAADRDSSGDAR